VVASLVAATALVVPAGGAHGRANALPTRVPGTLTVAVDIGTIGLAEGSVVNGAMTRRFDEDTGARPGRLHRSGAPAETALAAE